MTNPHIFSFKVSVSIYLLIYKYFVFQECLRMFSESTVYLAAFHRSLLIVIELYVNF